MKNKVSLLAVLIFVPNLHSADADNAQVGAELVKLHSKMHALFPKAKIAYADAALLCAAFYHDPDPLIASVAAAKQLPPEQADPAALAVGEQLIAIIKETQARGQRLLEKSQGKRQRLQQEPKPRNAPKRKTKQKAVDLCRPQDPAQKEKKDDET